MHRSWRWLVALISTWIFSSSLCESDDSIISRRIQLCSGARSLESINESNTITLSEQLSLSLSHTLPQPSLRVCIVTRITPDITDYAVHSHLVQSLFATFHHGHVLVPLYTDSEEEDYVYHRKLSLVLKTLNNASLGCDYVWWMDADWIPLDFHQVSLQSFVSSSECSDRSQIWLSRDVSTTVNTGSMIVRNTKWARDFLSQWIAVRNAPGVMNEQLGFDYLFMKMQEKGEKELRAFLERVCVLDPHRMNSVLPAFSRQEKDHRVLHLAAEDNYFRKRAFEYGANRVCENILSLSDGESTLPHQLGLSREKLSEIAHESYLKLMEEHEATLQALIASLEFSTPERLKVLIETCTAFRMSSSKFAHVLAFSFGRENNASISIRYRAYTLVAKALQKLLQLLNGVESFSASALFARMCSDGRYVTNERQRSIFSVLPEMIKISSELAFEFVTAAWALRFHEEFQLFESPVLAVTEELHVLLQFLLNIVHPSQKHAIETMLKNFESFMAMTRKFDRS